MARRPRGWRTCSGGGPQVYEGADGSACWEGYWRGATKEARDGATWLATQCAIGDVVTELVDGVRLRVGIQQMAGPVQSWDCPNLPSAIYLQFYWLVTQNRPIRHCEYCGQAFELTREDKNVCDPSCRSGLRYERQKRRKDSDTTLTPLGTQHLERAGKPEKRKPFVYTGMLSFASLGNNSLLVYS